MSETATSVKPPVTHSYTTGSKGPIQRCWSQHLKNPNICSKASRKPLFQVGTKECNPPTLPIFDLSLETSYADFSPGTPRAATSTPQRSHQRVPSVQSSALESYHAVVQILVHLAEGVWRSLSLAGDDDADVCDSQGVLGHVLSSPAVGDVHPLGRGAAADVGRPPVRGALNDFTALLDSFLAII